jgi:hypothetical protein
MSRRALVQTRPNSTTMDGCHDSYRSKNWSAVRSGDRGSVGLLVFEP